MTILNCECGNEIYIMDETAATAWQCDACGQWYDFFGVKVPDPATVKPKKSPRRQAEIPVSWAKSNRNVTSFSVEQCYNNAIDSMIINR